MIKFIKILKIMFRKLLAGLFFWFCADASGQNLDGMTSATFYTWTNNNWVNWIYQEHSYDAQNRVVHILYKVWDVPTQSWKNSSQVAFTYDALGNNSQQDTENWNAALQIWQQSTRATLTYTAANQIEQSTIANWLNNSWQNSVYYHYTYDAALYLTQFTYSTVSADAQDAQSRTLYTNDAAGNATENLTQTKTLGNWVNSSRELRSYNANQATQMTRQQWTSGNWVNLKRESYTYDTNAYLTAQTNENWSGTSWIVSGDVLYENNPNGTLDVYTSRNWNAATQSWTNYQKATYTYNLLSRLDADTNRFVLWPNPAPAFFAIEGADNHTMQMEIWDVNGRKISTEQLSAPQRIATDAWPSGIYFVKLEQGSSSQTVKLVKP